MMVLFLMGAITRKWIRFVAFLAVVSSVFILFGFSQQACANDSAMPWPRNLDQVDIYLHTVDAGDAVYSKFGHTAVRIVDHVAATDRVYNLGTFDASDPLFVVNFYRGRMFYNMSDYTMSNAYGMYVADQRTMWEDSIDFSLPEKKRFLEKLIWQSQPENRTYAYQYFFDNCATRIRDFFDYALDARLASQTMNQITPDTFRKMVRDHFASISIIGLSLDIIMNGNLDRPMSAWEEMFLPLRLRSNLMPMLSESGRPLIASSRVLYQGIHPKPDSPGAYFWMMTLALIPLLFSARQLLAKVPPIHAIRYATWTFLSVTTSIGLLMFTNWMFSGHLDLHHNANLFIFFPLDGALLWLIHRRQFFPVAKLYSLMRIFGILGVTGLSEKGFITQDVQPIGWTFGILLVVYFVMLMVALSKPEPSVSDLKSS